MKKTPAKCERTHADECPELHAAAITLGGNTYPEAEARARLWNAAPDLLAACKLALDHVEELHEAFRSGALTGTDGKVGLRANRNVDVECELRRQIAKAVR